MTPVPLPQTRLAYSTEPQPADRTEFRARKPQTHFTVYGMSIAAHLGALGFQVESIIRDGRVEWRAPFDVKSAARKYQNTFRALDNGRKRVFGVIAASHPRLDARLSGTEAGE